MGRLVWRVFDTSQIVPLVQLSRDSLVPLFHFFIWSGREDISGNVLGEDGAIGARNIPDPNRLLEEVDVFLRAKQDLDGHPAREAGRGQAGNSRGFKGRWRRLEVVETPQGLVHEREDMV